MLFLSSSKLLQSLASGRWVLVPFLAWRGSSAAVLQSPSGGGLGYCAGMAARQKISVRVAGELVERADFEAARLGLNRSQVVEWALEEALPAVPVVEVDARGLPSCATEADLLAAVLGS